MAWLSAGVNSMLNALGKVGLHLCFAIICTMTKHLTLVLPTVIQGFIFGSNLKLLKRKRPLIYLDFTNRICDQFT